MRLGAAKLSLLDVWELLISSHRFSYMETMYLKVIRKSVIAMILFASAITGCAISQTEMPKFPMPTISETTLIFPTINTDTQSPSFDTSDYAFPTSIDPSKRYMFYLHGKIIEDQGIPATSPDFGEYEYAAILEKLSGYDFDVVSKQRSKNTDGMEYARRVTKQITTLLGAGVPAKNITVVGTSKGAGIAIFVSHLLENESVNFVILTWSNIFYKIEYFYTEISCPFMIPSMSLLVPVRNYFHFLKARAFPHMMKLF